jgi:hypothetical protein
VFTWDGRVGLPFCSFTLAISDSRLPQSHIILCNFILE